MIKQRKLLLLLVLLSVVISCGDRAMTPGSDGGVSGDGSPDGKQYQDIPRVRKDAGEAPGHCSGETRFAINGQALTLTQVTSHLTWNASCCPPGELLRFEAVDSNGKGYAVNVEIYRQPEVERVSHLDLADRPPDWFINITCEPNDECGLLSAWDPEMVLISGFLDYAPVQGKPATLVSLCLQVSRAAPYLMPPPPESFRSLNLWAKHLPVNLACVPGMDQTCNENSLISSLRGSCSAEGVCTCLDGAQKVPATGKCQ